MYIIEWATLESTKEFLDNLNEMIIAKFNEKPKHIFVLTKQKMTPITTMEKNTSTH